LAMITKVGYKQQKSGSDKIKAYKKRADKSTRLKFKICP